MTKHRRNRSSKRSVRCTICTTHRWLGNGKDRFKKKDEQEMRDKKRLQETGM